MMGRDLLTEFLRCERGSAAVEQMLVMPLLILLAFGSIEASHYFYSEHQVIKGVRDAARYASRELSPSTPCNTDVATQEIRNVARFGTPSPATGQTPRLWKWADTDTKATIVCLSGGVKAGIYDGFTTDPPAVRVYAIVNYPSLFGTLGVFDVNFKLYASNEAPVVGI